MIRRKIIGLFVCLLLLITVVPVISSQIDSESFSTVPWTTQGSPLEDWIEMQKLLAGDGTAGDRFGWSVSLDGDTALIGAWRNEYYGSAYVFTRSGTSWTQQAKLTASDGEYGDYFGYSVSLDGDTALIGANSDDDNGDYSGSTYVFTRTGTTWTQQQKLIASDGAQGDYFGFSVSLDGDTALIGANHDDDNGDNSGSAYVFTRTGTTWTQQAKLHASDSTTGDVFGHTVALNGDSALIAALGDTEHGANSGSAYVFTCMGTTWTEQAKLLAFDGGPGDFFGISLSIDDDTALIGARDDYNESSGFGSVYIFTRTDTTWTHQQKLLTPYNETGRYFGSSVSLDDDTALIGAWGSDGYEEFSGAAYVFIRTGNIWYPQAKFYPSDGTVYDCFGYSVSLDGTTALIGAIQVDYYDTLPGKAYVFTKNQSPDPPTIDGQTNGKINIEYIYSFDSSDPNEDEVSYFIEWGDGTITNWTGFYPSGSPGYSESHLWTTKGTYTIRAKAIDINGDESGWGQLTVTMPCSYNIPFLYFWERLFQRFPNAFPLLRHMMGY